MSSAITTRVYKALKKFDPSKLVHIKCKVGEYKPLGTDFYAWVGTVKPYFNAIQTYQIQGKDGIWSPVYIF